MSGIGPRLAARLAAAVIVLPVAAWAVGVNWVFCLLIAGAAAAAVAILELPTLAQDPHWPSPDETRRGGGRREVTSLSWMLTSRHGGTDRAAVLRLRAIALRRLALQGIDLDVRSHHQRAIDMLGADVLAILMSDGSFSASHRQLVQCIEALERLDPASDRPASDRTVSGRTAPVRTTLTSPGQE